MANQVGFRAASGAGTSRPARRLQVGPTRGIVPRAPVRRERTGEGISLFTLCKMAGSLTVYVLLSVSHVDCYKRAETSAEVRQVVTEPMLVAKEALKHNVNELLVFIEDEDTPIPESLAGLGVETCNLGEIEAAIDALAAEGNVEKLLTLVHETFGELSSVQGEFTMQRSFDALDVNEFQVSG